MTFKLEGADALNAAIARIPKDIKREVRPALEKGADELVATMKALAPVDDGDLRESIRKEDGAHDMQVIVRAGGDRAWYAGIVEFGRKDNRGSARPFFWPAYRSLNRRIRGRINRAINAAVRKFHT